MDKQKKVLHLRSSGGLLGAENVILEIAAHGCRFGYQSVIGVLRHREDPSPEILSIAAKKKMPTVEFVCDRRIDLKAARAIRKFISTDGVDLMHCHGYKEDIYGFLSRASIPKMATNHLWKTNTSLLRLYRVVDGIVLRQFWCVAGVSGEIVRDMRRFGIRNPIKIQNGIDVHRFKIDPPAEGLAEKFGLPAGGTVFVMISSLTSEKNHAVAIAAMARLKQEKIQLLIVGDGPLEDELKGLVTRLRLMENVFFAGRQRNIREILSIAHVFLLPSLKEGLPMALLEAMACGKAVIVSGVGEIESVVADGVNGLVVENDPVAFARAMELLLNSRELMHDFGQQARNIIEKQFSSERMTRRYCRLYDRLIRPGQKKI